MEEHNTTNFTENNNNTTVENNFGMDLKSLGKDIFDSKHIVGSLVVFWGTILLIVGAAVYCWYRYFCNAGEDEMNTRNEDVENNDYRLDNSRRNTLVLNLRRQSRRETLILPFPFH